MYLYIKQHPAPRLYIQKSDAPSLFLQEPEMPSLYLSKAKNPNRDAKRGTFNIAARGGVGPVPEEVKGYKVGVYGAHHRKGKGLGLSWTITHIPTGLSMDAAENYKQAVGMIEFLQQAAPGAGKDLKFGKADIEDLRRDDMKTALEAKIVYKYGQPSPFDLQARSSEEIVEARAKWLKENNPHGRANELASSSRAERLSEALKEWGHLNDADDNPSNPGDELTSADVRKFEQRWGDVADEAMGKLPKTQGAVQTGPRGGRYIETAGGGKSYVGKSGPALYLDVEKANPNRDPSVGHFIAGGTSKAQSGEGQEDMSDFMNELMDKLPGEDMEKR